MAQKSPTIREYAKAGFGTGLGFLASFVIYIFIGFVFFIPGFVLLKKEQQKKKEEQSLTIKIVAYVLMALGMSIGLGMGSGIFFSELGGEF